MSLWQKLFSLVALLLILADWETLRGVAYLPAVPNAQWIYRAPPRNAAGQIVLRLTPYPVPAQMMIDRHHICHNARNEDGTAFLVAADFVLDLGEALRASVRSARSSREAFPAEVV